MDQLKSSTNVPFGPDGGGGSAPLIELDPAFYDDNDRHLLVYPTDAGPIVTNLGRIAVRGVKEVHVPGGILSITGDSADLVKQPAGEIPEFKTLFAFTEKGQPTGPVGARYDAATKKVILNQKCTCAISYGPYLAQALQVTYTPLTERLGDGVSVTYGVVAAYHQGAITVFEIPPLEEDDNGNAIIELYRIFSKKVINADGAFEKPPGFPTTGSYPGKSFVLDTTQAMEIERVHEIGFMNQRGYAWAETYTVSVLEPYVGDGNYVVALENRVSTLDPAKYSASLRQKAMDFIKSKGLAKGVS